MYYRFYLYLAALLGSAAFLPFGSGKAESLPAVDPPQLTAIPEAVPGPALPGPSSNSPSSLQHDRDFTRTAKEAYVWGWPLVYLHNCKRSFECVPAPGRSGGMPVAPPNQLCMLSDYISPVATGIPCPNQDVIYGFGILDLESESVVLQVPDFGDLFWLIQLGDQRTDSFARLGKMYGTKPGPYLIVGPDWQGFAPEGIVEVLRCPTRIGFCVPRVYIEDSQVAREKVQSIVNQIAAYPLDSRAVRWRTHDWSKSRWLPRIGANDRRKNRWIVPEKFFDDLADVIETVPAMPGEERLYAEMRQLIQSANSDERRRELLMEIARETERDVIAPLFDFRNVGRRTSHHWTTVHNGAAFGFDYLTRTAVAKSNIFVNRREETLYYYQDFDSSGSLLHGGRSYQITFPAHQVSAVKGFWSLSLYNEDHMLHVNEHRLHSLGTKSRKLTYNRDGSLTILVQPQPPTPEMYDNWLPTPPGPFSLYLRAYWPEETMLQANWTPPPVTQVLPSDSLAQTP